MIDATPLDRLNRIADIDPKFLLWSECGEAKTMAQLDEDSIRVAAIEAQIKFFEAEQERNRQERINDLIHNAKITVALDPDALIKFARAHKVTEFRETLYAYPIDSEWRRLDDKAEGLRHADRFSSIWAPAFTELEQMTSAFLAGQVQERVAA